MVHHLLDSCTTPDLAPACANGCIIRCIKNLLICCPFAESKSSCLILTESCHCRIQSVPVQLPLNSQFSINNPWSNFQTDISPWTHPKDWIQSNADHINSVVQVFADATGSSEMHWTRIYFFFALFVSDGNNSIFGDFKETLQKWRA